MIVFEKNTSLGSDNSKLCQFLDTAFDSAVIVDRDCNIINFGRGSNQLNADILPEYLGHNISEIDDSTPFHRVIETGTPIYVRPINIAGVDVLQSIYPIKKEGEIAGALAVATYFDIDLIKKQLLQNSWNQASATQAIIQECTRSSDDNPMHSSANELVEGDPVIESLLNGIYDSAIYVDTKGIILRCDMGRLKLSPEQIKEMKGRNISEFVDGAPFLSVIQGRHQIRNYLSIVLGRLCFNCIYPVFDPYDNVLTGVIGTIRYSHIDKLRILFESEDADVASSISARLEKTNTFQDFKGTSQATVNLLAVCRKIAPTEYPVLITGESGTGKEVIAGAIHSANQKHHINPYVRLNCSAIPNDLLESELFGYRKGAFTGAVKDKAGYFEIATNGTLLLDEIGDMDLKLQSKLLRVLESKVYSPVGDTRELPMNARIIASTNKDLYQMGIQGTFRQDLYYRLNTIEIKIPALRERPEDIPILISHFLLLNGENIGIRPDAMRLLMDYSWPGNVRELRNIINRICIFFSGKSISANDILPFLHDEITPQEKTIHIKSVNVKMPIISKVCTLREGEIALIKAALKEERYNLSNAAKVLGITRATLYNKLEKYQIDR